MTLSQTPMQAVVITQAAITANSTPIQLALFNPDGSAYDPTQAADLSGFLEAEPAAFQADFAGVDLAAVKVELNAFKAKLIAAGLMEAS